MVSVITSAAVGDTVGEGATISALVAVGSTYSGMPEPRGGSQATRSAAATTQPTSQSLAINRAALYHVRTVGKEPDP